jgi:hypothetical protein
METGDDACSEPAGDGERAAALLAEFRTWLVRERGLAAETVRCYGNHVKAFLAAIGGPEAVPRLDAGQVAAFMVDHSRDRNSWLAKAMVTSLRAFLRFAHVTGRTLIRTGQQRRQADHLCQQLPGPAAAGRPPQKMRRGAELPKRGESAKTDRCRYHQDDAAHHLLCWWTAWHPRPDPFPAAGGTEDESG